MSLKPANISNQPLAPTRIRTRAISYKSTKEDPTYRPSSRARRSESSRLTHDKWEGEATPSNFINGSWTREEDESIVYWVNTHGPTSWTKLAKLLPGRIGKQCRERWHNSLNPNVIKSQWTQKEDELICKYQAKLGNKWARISVMLPGRTDNAVKNRWNSTLKKRSSQILANMQSSASESESEEEHEYEEATPVQPSPIAKEESLETSPVVRQENKDTVLEVPAIDTPKLIIPPSPIIPTLFSPANLIKSPDRGSQNLSIDWMDPWNENMDFISENPSSTLFDVEQILCQDL